MTEWVEDWKKLKEGQIEGVKERKRKKDTDRKSEWVGEKSEQKGGQTEGEKDRKRKKERNREKREGENEI